MEYSHYLAHIAQDGREQTVLEHLKGTARLAANFASDFGAEEQGRLTGIVHDLGKYSIEFQRRLRGNAVQVDHSTAGAAECCKIGQNYAAFAVAGHHVGLPDGGGRSDHEDEPTFFGRMRRAKLGKLPACNAWQKELRLFPAPLPALSNPMEAMFFTRMLYSCLVDADFLDTETFMAGEEQDRGGRDGIDLLETKLQAYISGWFPAKNELNKERCALLQRCLEQGEAQNPGLFTMTIPTGGGKTVSSLAFALRHAKTHGMKRVIYVIPYTSIIEQNAQIFRDILGDENVLEYHSGVLYDVEDEATPENARLSRAVENWDMPVVVTTAVQFFESLFASRSSQCRKLHNLAKSVIIFDEAQMLPVSYLRPCVFAIAQLVKYYGASAVLCTATQPALDSIFREFVPSLPAIELCPQEAFHQEVFSRVVFQKEEKLPWEALAKRLGERQQTLCIVNSRKSAQTVYSLLDREGAFHLSTLMYPAHRKAVLEEIRARLKAGLPCRVVSTSLIEAGVDVDFPAVFREEAGLDSILQAAGRCNREGKRPAEESIVTIFRGEITLPSLFEIPVAAGRHALNRCEQPDSPEAIRCYFQELLNLKGVQALDQKRILTMMEREFMPFRKVSEVFHLIDSETKTVYIPLGAGYELTQRLQSGERNRKIFRELGQYGVSVYPQHFEAMDAAGDLDVLEDGTAVLSNLSLYRGDTGLSLTAEHEKFLLI
ncbi:MAG: CRISPR-associated helicase Cas3' [Clostridiales bacterium]|nr:CRISPR-associated helicase Cas3' [Clostridiales bacterium]